LPAPKSAIEAILEAAQSGEFSLALGDWVAAEAERRVVDRLEERLGNLNGFETPAGLLAMPPIRLRP
jgi:hypothetical protein